MRVMKLSQAGTWDPLLQRYNACTWTNFSSGNKIQRNYKKPKITVCMSSWGKLWTKGQKDQKRPIPTFEEPGAKNRVLGAKAGHCSYPLHTTPPKGWAGHLSHPSGPTPGHTLTLTPYKEPARPPASASKQAREPVACSSSPLLQQAPNKASPELLVWPLINFY